MKRIAATALALVVAAPACAADLGVAPVFVAPPPAWTGLYLGVNAGWGRGRDACGPDLWRLRQ